jgi:phospholipid/cholesterol/gamma-HCH transport system substrate-binding protein
METRANYALIGLFTLSVILAAFGFVLWYAGGEKPGNRQTYKVIFTGSISGLSRGGWVLFNGVRVGEVTQIGLMPNDPSQVYALIDVDASVPVHTDTKATLEYTGFTGVASVALTGGATDTPPLIATNGPPVIRAEPSTFQDLVETARRVAAQATEFLNKGNKLLEENSASLTATIKNAEIFTGGLAANADQIKDFMAVMGDVGRSLQPLTVKLESLVTNADNVIKAVDPADVKTIVKDFASLSAKLDKAANRIDGILANLDSILGSGESKGAFVEVAEAARSIKKVAQNLDSQLKQISVGLKNFTGPGLRQYEALAVEGRKTLDQINRAVRSIETNPQQFLFGRSPEIPEYSGGR